MQLRNEADGSAKLSLIKLFQKNSELTSGSGHMRCHTTPVDRLESKRREQHIAGMDNLWYLPVLALEARNGFDLHSVELNGRSLAYFFALQPAAARS